MLPRSDVWGTFYFPTRSCARLCLEACLNCQQAEGLITADQCIPETTFHCFKWYLLSGKHVNFGGSHSVVGHLPGQLCTFCIACLIVGSAGEDIHQLMRRIWSMLGGKHLAICNMVIFESGNAIAKGVHFPSWSFQRSQCLVSTQVQSASPSSRLLVWRLPHQSMNRANEVFKPGSVSEFKLMLWHNLYIVSSVDATINGWGKPKFRNPWVAITQLNQAIVFFPGFQRLVSNITICALSWKCHYQCWVSKL